MSKSIFFIGARGYTKNYGGWETFLQGLLDNWKDKNYSFYVFEIVHNINEVNVEVVNGITCIRIYVPESGGSTMMKYDKKSTDYALDYIRKNEIKNAVLYYLGLRIGPLVYLMRHKMKKMGIIVIENAAGLEWKRTKWNKLVQIYLWISAYLMAKASDYLVCDSEGILTTYEKFIKSKRPKKRFIPYGTYPSPKMDYVLPSNVELYFNRIGVEVDNYYLNISRFVPENSFELIISEFMKSKTKTNLVLVNNYDKESTFFEKLKMKLNFDADPRIKFVGTVYDKEILNYLRKNARGYINGHTLGGTNPGLLEAMSISDVNLLFDVVFSRQVGRDAVLYFDKKNKLSLLIDYCDAMPIEEREHLGYLAKERMDKYYSWNHIVDLYESLFSEIFD
jgi:rhamnosyltransferase